MRTSIQTKAHAAAGEVKVPDVMFPGGSPELVEPIYKNPKLSAPFNEQLTAIICDYVRNRLPSLGPDAKVRRYHRHPQRLLHMAGRRRSTIFSSITLP